MTPVMDLLEREDLMPLAEYFSKKKWPSLGQPPAPADVAARAQRANGSVGCLYGLIAGYNARIW